MNYENKLEKIIGMVYWMIFETPKIMFKCPYDSPEKPCYTCAFELSSSGVSDFEEDSHQNFKEIVTAVFEDGQKIEIKCQKVIYVDGRQKSVNVCLTDQFTPCPKPVSEQLEEIITNQNGKKLVKTRFKFINFDNPADEIPIIECSYDLISELISKKISKEDFLKYSSLKKHYETSGGVR